MDVFYINNLFNYNIIKIANNLTDESIKIFSENIQYITKLEELDLRNNSISEEGIKLLSKYLPKFHQLKGLYLHDNKITNKEEIKRIIKENHPNKQLDVIF